MTSRRGGVDLRISAQFVQFLYDVRKKWNLSWTEFKSEYGVGLRRLSEWKGKLEQTASCQVKSETLAVIVSCLAEHDEVIFGHVDQGKQHVMIFGCLAEQDESCRIDLQLPVDTCRTIIGLLELGYKSDKPKVARHSIRLAESLTAHEVRESREECQQNQQVSSGSVSTQYPPMPGQLALQEAWILPNAKCSGRPEFRYGERLYRFAGRKIAYLPVFDGWKRGDVEYRREDIDMVADEQSYQLPTPFTHHSCNCRSNDDKVRFINYDYKGTAQPNHRLLFRFSKAKYRDHLMVGPYLDEPQPGCEGTFRDQYAPMFNAWEDFFSRTELPNICGVGLFLRTADSKIIVAKQSRFVSIYPGRLSYAASGTMDWRSKPDPFLDVARECEQEIGHKVSFNGLRLFALGIDAKQFYFQFSFVEQTEKESAEIIERGPHALDYAFEVERLRAIDFTLEAVVAELMGENWEPAAGAALLTLCSKEFGYEQVASCLKKL